MHYLAGRGLSWWGGGPSERKQGPYWEEEGSSKSWNLALLGGEMAVRWVERGVSLQSDFMPVRFQVDMVSLGTNSSRLKVIFLSW